MANKDALKKMTWLKEERNIGRFQCKNKGDNQDLSTLINQVILALGKPEPLEKNKQFDDVCEHCENPFYTKLEDDFFDFTCTCKRI